MKKIIKMINVSMVVKEKFINCLAIIGISLLIIAFCAMCFLFIPIYVLGQDQLHKIVFACMTLVGIGVVFGFLIKKSIGELKEAIAHEEDYMHFPKNMRYNNDVEEDYYNRY